MHSQQYGSRRASRRHSNTSAVSPANGWGRGEGRECCWSTDFANLRFQGQGDALDELCAQLTHDLFAIVLVCDLFAIFSCLILLHHVITSRYCCEHTPGAYPILRSNDFDILCM